MELSTGDIAAVALYFLLILGIGLWVSNKQYLYNKLIFCYLVNDEA